MRRVLSFSCLAILVMAMACGSGDMPNEDNSWTGANLRGQVKSVTEVGFQATRQNGEWIKGARNQTYSIKTYSPTGFIISERRYYSDTNEFNSGFEYVYDEDGNVTRINALDPEGNVSGFSDVQKRDGKVGIRQYTDFFGNGINSMATGSTEMKWENHRLLESKAYQITGDIISHVKYEYNSHGDVSKFIIDNFGQGQKDVTINSTYLEFDEQDNWLRQLKEYEGYPVTEIVERRYEYYE
ncbi:MAG: hypothetical protein Roseis2KO_57270 [Roseivirga sp.]